MTPEPAAELTERYFAGDLDRVEKRDFERRLTEDEPFREHFEAEYDARTSRDRWSALPHYPSELLECFSTRTLERYVNGDLDPEARRLVERHLSCSWCRGEVEALRALASDRDPGARPTSSASSPPPAAATRRSRAPRSARRRIAQAFATVAAIVVVAGVGIFSGLERRPAASPSLSIRVVTGEGPVYRSRSATVGQRMTVRLTSGSHRHAALRIYLRGLGVQRACPSDAACRRTEDGWEADVVLDRRGTYEVVGLASDVPAPEPAGDADADVARAPDGEVLFETVEVR